MLNYQSVQELVDAANAAKCTIGELTLREQAEEMGQDEIMLLRQMDKNFTVMEEAIAFGQRQEQTSMSGLTGGEGWKMLQYSKQGEGVSGSFMTRAMSRALAVAGCNASMGKIVAAPTAGSCGILPACLASLLEDRGVEREAVVMSMFTAGAFGMVIAQRASIAGAQGGCQAECGSAAGMAAAAMVEVMGGTPRQCADACAIAIVNQMGLVCDPVAGLVEIPCIKRNVAGVMTAFSSADMALAGIRPYIPIDECIEAMREVGDALPAALKETAIGGLAGTPTGKALRRRVFGRENEP